MFSTSLSMNFMFGIVTRCPLSRRSRVERKPISSTLPVCPPKTTKSPMTKGLSKNTVIDPNRFLTDSWAASDTASWLAHTPGPEVRRTAQQIDEILAGRALYVTTRATPEVLDQVRRRMLEERSTSLARAQELVLEVREQKVPNETT